MSRDLIETSRNITESEAIMAALDEESAAKLIKLAGFTVSSVRRNHNKKDFSISGTVSTEDTFLHAGALVVFPGFFSRSLARLQRREPNARANIWASLPPSLAED